MCHWLACLWALTLELVDDKFPKWMLKACRFRNALRASGRVSTFVLVFGVY